MGKKLFGITLTLKYTGCPGGAAEAYSARLVQSGSESRGHRQVVEIADAAYFGSTVARLLPDDSRDQQQALI